jgi:hypothetical protein
VHDAAKQVASPKLRKASRQDQSGLGKLASVPCESEFEPRCPLGQADCSRKFRRLTDVWLQLSNRSATGFLPTTILHLREPLTKRYRLNIPAPIDATFLLPTQHSCSRPSRLHSLVSTDDRNPPHSSSTLVADTNSLKETARSGPFESLPTVLRPIRPQQFDLLSIEAQLSGCFPPRPFDRG